MREDTRMIFAEACPQSAHTLVVITLFLHNPYGPSSKLLRSPAEGGVWFILEVEGERRGVYRNIVLTRKVLLSGREEALREEKPADPKHLTFGGGGSRRVCLRRTLGRGGQSDCSPSHEYLEAHSALY